MATKETVTRDTIIGHVISDIPGGRTVIEKYFGNGCFSCAGINVESIAFGATMHNMDADKIINEINSLEVSNES